MSWLGDRQHYKYDPDLSSHTAFHDLARVHRLLERKVKTLSIMASEALYGILGVLCPDVKMTADLFLGRLGTWGNECINVSRRLRKSNDQVH